MTRDDRCTPHPARAGWRKRRPQGRAALLSDNRSLRMETALERTLTIIKPDAVRAGHVGDVVKMFEANGLRIAAARMANLTRREAEGFYAVHRTKPFFESLTSFMSSGPALVMVLEGENAIARLRELMGATDPAKAAPGTVRNLYAQSIERNAIHGSDAPETAAFEIAYFFAGIDLV
jgi:nucleoside-diphosphate kinase